MIEVKTNSAEAHWLLCVVMGAVYVRNLRV